MNIILFISCLAFSFWLLWVIFHEHLSMSLCVNQSVFLLVKYLEVGLLNHMMCVYLYKKVVFFPKWLYHFIFLSSIYEISNCTTIPSSLIIVNLFHFSHRVALHWYLDMILTCLSLLMMLSIFSCTYLVKCLLKTFVHFLNSVVCVLTVLYKLCVPVLYLIQVVTLLNIVISYPIEHTSNDFTDQIYIRTVPVEIKFPNKCTTQRIFIKTYH